MAIEHSTIDQQYDFMRNAPTPKIIEDLDLFQDSYDNLQYGGDMNFDSLLSHQTIVFKPQGTGDQVYSDAMSGALTPVAHTNQYMAQPYTTPYSPFQSSDGFNGIHAVTGRDSVTSKLSRNKEKCMSRNAIAARENREKKKNEVNTLRDRVASLEEENALLKKKYHEFKDVYKQDHERLKYFESLFSNLSTIMPFIEHMKTVPKHTDEATTAKKIKKKLNINNDLGICFHVKTNEEMSLRFCETCSGGSSSKKRHLET